MASDGVRVQRTRLEHRDGSADESDSARSTEKTSTRDSSESETKERAPAAIVRAILAAHLPTGNTEALLESLDSAQAGYVSGIRHILRRDISAAAKVLSTPNTVPTDACVLRLVPCTGADVKEVLCCVGFSEHAEPEALMAVSSARAHRLFTLGSQSQILNLCTIVSAKAVQREEKKNELSMANSLTAEQEAENARWVEERAQMLASLIAFAQLPRGASRAAVADRHLGSKEVAGQDAIYLLEALLSPWQLEWNDADEFLDAMIASVSTARKEEADEAATAIVVGGPFEDDPQFT